MKKSLLKLTATEGPVEGSGFLLKDDKNTIGRGDDSTICIPDRAISKKHCQIISSGSQYYIVDLESTNGTFLDGIRLLPNKMYELRKGVEIKIGRSRIDVSMEEVDVPEKPTDEEDTAVEELEKLKEAQPPAPDERPEAEPSDRAKKVPQKIITYRVGSNRNLSAMYKLLSAVSVTSDVDSLLESTIDIVMETIKSEQGCIFLKEDLTEAPLTPRITRAAGKSTSTLKVSETIIKKVIAGKDSILSTQAPSDQRLFGSKGAEFKITSILCAPLKIKEELHGLIYLETTRPSDVFKTEDLEFLSAIGILLGCILKNKELLSQN